MTAKQIDFVFRCTYNGCKAEQIGRDDDMPRHRHGQALVEMRKIPELRGSYYNPIAPDNKKKRVKANG